MLENKLSCFYCEHLILDGMSSWCELKNHRAAGNVANTCREYIFNKYRYKSVAYYTNLYNKRSKKEMDEARSINASVEKL